MTGQLQNQSMVLKKASDLSGSKIAGKMLDARSIRKKLIKKYDTLNSINISIVEAKKAKNDGEFHRNMLAVAMSISLMCDIAMEEFLAKAVSAGNPVVEEAIKASYGAALDLASVAGNSIANSSSTNYVDGAITKLAKNHAMVIEKSIKYQTGKEVTIASDAINLFGYGKRVLEIIKVSNEVVFDGSKSYESFLNNRLIPQIKTLEIMLKLLEGDAIDIINTA